MVSPETALAETALTAPEKLASALPGLVPPLLGPVGTTTAPSGSLSASSPAHGGGRAATSLRVTSRRRAWPLYAVIGGAALIGSFAMALAMRSGSAAEVAEVSTASQAAAVPLHAKSEISVVPIIETPPDAGAQPKAPAGLVAASLARPAPPVIAAPVIAVRAASRGTDPARVASRSVEPVPAAGPVHPAVPHDDIARAFAAHKFDQVVAQCSGGPVSAEHAPLCFIAACHVGDEPRARRLISAVPVARRDPLIASCQQLGVDVAAKQTVARPVDDCEADPMACQH